MFQARRKLNALKRFGNQVKKLEHQNVRNDCGEKKKSTECPDFSVSLTIFAVAEKIEGKRTQSSFESIYCFIVVMSSIVTKT